MTASELWTRYCDFLCAPQGLDFALDVSRMKFTPEFLATMEPRIQKAMDAMEALEKGAIANPDEKRQVGHYWLRNPDIAPDALRHREVVETLAGVKELVRKIQEAEVHAERMPYFNRVLVVGIGGSALGPQFIHDALGTADDEMAVSFIDNTDPDGIDRVLGEIGPAGLESTVVLIISKSGGTKETRNGMLEVRAAYEKLGMSFPRHAVAVTGVGSALDKIAVAEGWLARLPMFDWVGGRTSEFSAVGLLPAALQGVDIDALLQGAADMDKATRNRVTRQNPAALMALMWYHATNGRGEKDMVVLPYKDRLVLLSKYLQQLVMESLGKEHDVDGKVVNQGIAVYGNKGSTDQHAYVQQLRDGVHNFFTVFVEVLKAREGESMKVDPMTTTGDYLTGFLLGTREALYEKGRESMTITVADVSPRSVGMLIALFERAVGFYATLTNINAYHQPGVEAGKKAAESILALQRRLIEAMMAAKPQGRSAAEWAATLGEADRAETVFKLLQHLAAEGWAHAAPVSNKPTDTRFAAP